jgi:hypothetical protein
MKKYSKKELKLKSDKKGKKIHVTEKHTKMFEDGNAYVNPSSDSITSLGSDINKSRTQNPTDKNFVVDLSSYDGNSQNNPVALDVNANNGTDAQKKIQQTITTKPQLKSMMNNGQLQANVRIHNENIEKLRESSIPFTKKEITELLLNK